VSDLVREVRSIQVVLVVGRRWGIFAHLTIVSISGKRATTPVPVDRPVTADAVEVIVLAGNGASGTITAIAAVNRPATRRLTTSTRPGASAARGRASSAPAGRLATTVEPPASRRRGTGPLDFQVIITTDATTVHLIVSIISIATRFILHKRK